MVGAIAIVVSLIYVGVQLRQNTRATRVSTSQAFIQIHDAAVNPIIQEPAFRDIYWRGLAGVSNLHGSELAAFGAWTGNTIRAWESFYFQWKEHAFGDPMFFGWNHQFLDLFGYPGVQEVWKFAAITSATNFVSLWDESSPARSQNRSTPLLKARTYRVVLAHLPRLLRFQEASPLRSPSSPSSHAVIAGRRLSGMLAESRMDIAGERCSARLWRPCAWK